MANIIDTISAEINEDAKMCDMIGRLSINNGQFEARCSGGVVAAKFLAEFTTNDVLNSLAAQVKPVWKATRSAAYLALAAKMMAA